MAAQQERFISGGVNVVESDFLFEDELVDRFAQQLNFFPQEKIYLHTDKPYYLSGERIWFRAYLADASSHIPVSYSRYVYVELINPLDTAVVRVKIREEEGAYYGYLPIPNDAPEGNYTLRAYTTFIRSQDENYFFTKAIRIGDPQSGTVHVDTDFKFTPGNRGMERIDVTFRFSQINLNGSFDPFVPQSARVSVNKGPPMAVSIASDGTAGITFDLPANSRQRTILVETVTSRNPYLQYILIPTPDDDFDVTFYPEGGSLMQGVSCKVAFKAMQSNGQVTPIAGVIFDQNGIKVSEIHSDYLGMGSFVHPAEKGKSYYAVCENDKGQSKRFDLPAAFDRGYSLTVNPIMDRIRISVLQPADTKQNDTLYLLAHTRGEVHFVELWNHDRNLFVIPKDALPSGVLHLVLFDAGSNPVSERLVFINNMDDYAQVDCQTNQSNFVRRSLVTNRTKVTDIDGQPVTGSFSVSVTSDKEVKPDSTSSIFTQLLLSSDLYGYIEKPAYYFQKIPEATFALDLLMLTQGCKAPAKTHRFLK